MLTTDQKKAILAKMEQKRLELGMSQSEVASQVNVSGATITNAIKEKWANISDKIFLSIAKWADYSLKREWVMHRTLGNYMKLNGICRASQMGSKSIAVSYEAGMGKSTALKDYASNNREAYYVECSEYFTKKVFLQKILSAIGAKDTTGSISDLVDRITESLGRKNKPIVIFDEMDKLSDNILNFYITIYNRLEGQCGFVCAGAPFFESRIKKGAKNNKRGYREIMSRFGGVFEGLRDISTAETEELCRLNGIENGSLINKVVKESIGRDLRYIRNLIEKVTLI